MGYIDSIKQFFVDLFQDLFDFFLDLPKYVLHGILDAIVYIVDVIPSPDFLSDYSISQAIPSDISWLLVQAGFPEALSIFASAILFKFIRRVVTLGVW